MIFFDNKYIIIVYVNILHNSYIKIFTSHIALLSFLEVFSMPDYLLIPILIFFARIIDVSLSTIRIISISRNYKFLAPILGFVEVFIWITAVARIMNGMANIYSYIAYAGGFATGTFIGLIIEEKLALGILIVRIILVKNDNTLKDNLSKAGFGVTIIDGHGVNGKVKLIYTVIKRKDLNKVVNIINNSSKKAFYSVEDARITKQGVFPA